MPYVGDVYAQSELYFKMQVNGISLVNELDEYEVNKFNSTIRELLGHV